jgi:hypothetical protein
MSTKNLARSLFEDGKRSSVKDLIRCEIRAERRNSKQKIQKMDLGLVEFWDEDLRGERDFYLGRLCLRGWRALDRLMRRNVGSTFDSVYSYLNRINDRRSFKAYRLLKDARRYCDRDIFGGRSRFYVPQEPLGEVFTNSEGILSFHPRLKREKVKTSSSEEIFSFLKNRKVIIVGQKMFWVLANNPIRVEVGRWGAINYRVLFTRTEYFWSAEANKHVLKRITSWGPASDRKDPDERKPYLPPNFVSWRQGNQLSKKEIDFYCSMNEQQRKMITHGGI